MDMSKYLDLYLSESREHLAAAEENLQVLASGERGQVVHDLFRHAHSLKGMANSMGFATVGGLAHRVEDLLDLLREERVEVDHSLLALLHRGFDEVSRLVDRLEGGDSAAAADPELLAELSAVAAASEASADPGAETSEREERPMAAAGEAAPPAPAASAERTPAAVPLRVDLLYAPGTLLPAARALIALKQLATLGTVVSSDPPREKIHAGEFAGRLRALVETEREAEGVQALLAALPDVESASVRRDEATEPAAAGEPASPASVPQTVRVRTGHLDRLLELVGELIVHRGRLEARMEPETAETLRGELDRVRALVGDLFETVMDLRLLPFETVAHRLVRSVRELARELGKKVAFAIEGREVGLDRSLLEELVDPLQHLLRNALDHGLESPAERAAAGKSETGTLTLRLERRSDSVLLELEDDGRGMDPELIRRTARVRGLLESERLERLDETELLMLVTTPGFSTAERLSSISGRGVGMDVVRTRIENLGGRLELRSRKGRGTAVRLILPLTLSVLEAFLVEAGERSYVVPVSSVQRTLELVPSEVQFRQGRPHLVLDERAVPLFDLGSLLAPCGERAVFDRPRPLLLFRSGERSVALSVDAIRSRRELVVKPLGPPLELLPEFSGATVLDQGEVALILDLPNLVSPARSAAAGR